MPEYRFYQDATVITTERTYFTIDAHSPRHAIERIQSFDRGNVDNHQNDEDIDIYSFESLFECSNTLTPEQNGGCSTLMIYDEETGNVIADNAAMQSQQ